MDNLNYNILLSMFNESYFEDYEERLEYYKNITLLSSEEDIIIYIRDLNNRIIDPVTHIGRYNMSDINKHLKKIIN